jgi:sigma-B regulation protein RsbU (phosphoserine phosphatase)
MGSFITFFWGILDDEKKELTFVNAGHNPPLLVRGGELTKLKKGGMILGVMETTIPYESESVKLRKGDKIFLFTDGITEAMDKNMQEYSDERLEEFVKKLSEDNAQSSIDKLVNDVVEFTQGAEQSDDITCLVINVL